MFWEDLRKLGTAGKPFRSRRPSHTYTHITYNNTLRGSSPVAVVDGVSEPWSVYDGEGQLNPSLLYQHFGLLHL